MKKNPIGILDSGYEGISVLERMTKYLKNEDIIYVNDYFNYPYEGQAAAEIVKFVQEKVEFLLTQNIKALIVVSDVIVEYCSDYFLTLNIPVYNTVNIIIDYIHEKYEQKNLALMARNDILESNMYQKNFKYNHLYNLPSDELEKLINENEIKTSKSFAAVDELSKLVNKKEIDVIIPSSPFLIKLKTEFSEYMNYSEIIDVGQIIGKKLESENLPLYEKKKGKVICYSCIKRKSFKNMTRWLSIKYKFKKIKGKVNVN